ncbi:hypothetical protein ACFLV6_02890 [Chloroflexota bacterium]
MLTNPELGSRMLVLNKKCDPDKCCHLLLWALSIWSKNNRVFDFDSPATASSPDRATPLGLLR